VALSGNDTVDDKIKESNLLTRGYLESDFNLVLKPAQTLPWVIRSLNFPRVNEVNTREQNQQNRIANGLQNGTMTAGQAARAENREQHIQNQEKADMAANNGHLTKGEQKQLNREQNRTSRQIYKDKH
jgi:hypothetical protein